MVTTGFQQAAHPEPDIGALARRRGVPIERANRLTQFIQALLRARRQPALTITELKSNPGRFIDQAILEGPLRLGDGKRKDRRNALLVLDEDIDLLREVLEQVLAPRHVTGAEVVARYGHDGPPTQLSLEPYSEPPLETPDIEADLAEGRAPETTNQARGY